MLLSCQLLLLAHELDVLGQVDEALEISSDDVAVH